ncbi:MAG: hypothetical protein PVI90_10395 [Desulfobacteraceae bacterium]
MQKLIILLFITFLVGCSPAYFQPQQPGKEYLDLIKDWQDRILQEGWNESFVDEIMAKCVFLSKYKADPKGMDHWMTYREFIDTFQGDCEDIAAFMYGTLKRLNYPEPIRMRILRMPMGDHAVVMVRSANGRWKMFNSVPTPGQFIDLAFSRILVEWDDERIYYP